MNRARRSIARCTAVLACVFASQCALAEPALSQEQTVQNSQALAKSDVAIEAASHNGESDTSQQPPCTKTDVSVLPVYVPPSRGQARLRAAAATRGS
ncbi:MAG: hypothetical protein ACR2PZ_02115 [Pseudomonadales bacterium]